MLKRILRNMSKRNTKNLALAKKLNRVQELQSERKVAESSTDIPDIEDAPTAKTVVQSIFFSPLQTRRQRILNSQRIEKRQVPGAEKKSKTVAKEESICIEEPFEPKTIKIEAPKIKLNNVILEPSDENAETVEDMKEFKSPKKVINSEDWEPPNWRDVFENIRQMRANEPAPVDTMGCQACADKDSDDKTQRFHKLLALMLSSQTKDETTFEAMQRLKAHTKHLTPEAIAAMATNTLEQLLCPVSFYKNKAKYLQHTARILINQYNGDIPNNIKELIALPGVGPKMAHICMSTAWNEITGIGVDVHVHRISNRLGWVQRETKEPEQTRIALEAWLPRDLWHDVNYLFVGFGQTICTPVRPKCSECLNRNLCPSAFKITPKKKSASREDNGEKTPAKKPRQTPNKQHASDEETNETTIKTKTKQRTKKQIQL